MKASIRKIDMYGEQASLSIFGLDKFRTTLGGFFTGITFLLMLTFAWFFGSNFFYKSNPTVTYSERPRPTGEFRFPTSNVDTFMFRLQKGGSFEYINPESTPFKLSAVYKHYNVNDAGEVKIYFRTRNALSRCSETLAKQNENLTNYKLEEWFCFDWEKVAEIGKKKLQKPEYRPIFGGLPGDSQYGTFLFNILSCDYNDENLFYNFSTEEQVKEYNLNNVQAVSVFPHYSFDADNLKYPINFTFSESSTYFEYDSIRIHDHYMQLSNLEDDRGYVFKDIRSKQAMKKIETSKDTNKEMYYIGNIPVFQPHLAIFYLDSLEIQISRRYMVFQELCALVGGFMKFIVVGFLLVTTYNTHYEKSRFLANKMFQSRTDSQTGNISMELKAIKVNTIVEKKETGSDSRHFTLNGFAYYFQCWGRRTEEFKHQLKLVEVMRKEIERKLDIKTLFTYYEKIEKLSEMLCTEEQKIELHNLENEELMV